MKEVQHKIQHLSATSKSASPGFAGKNGHVLQDNRIGVVQQKLIPGTVENTAPAAPGVTFFGVVQMVRRPKGAKRPKAVATKGAKAKAAASGGGTRYPGHDSAANKRALIEVLNHRV